MVRPATGGTMHTGGLADSTRQRRRMSTGRRVVLMLHRWFGYRSKVN
jgi:hypothetical protein